MASMFPTSHRLVGRVKNMTAKKTTASFKSNALKVHGNLVYDYSLSVYVDAKTKVEIICLRCGRHFWQIPRVHLKGMGCSKCSHQVRAKKRLMSKEECLARFKDRHGERYNYERVVYRGQRTKVKIWCDRHGYFDQNPVDHWGGQGCPDCGRLQMAENQSWSLEDFICAARDRHDEDYCYERSIYLGGGKKLEISCRTCKKVFWQTPGNHLSGKGCKFCAARRYEETPRKTREEFALQATSIHGPLYGYDAVIYVDALTPVKIWCDNHGYFRQSPDRHLQRAGCPKCGAYISRGERRVSAILDDCGIDYVPRWRHEECRSIRPLPFDFFLPKFNALIEYDGQQHFTPATWWGSCEVKAMMNFKELQVRDRIKTEWARKRGIPLLRIRFDDDLDAVLIEFIEGLRDR